MVIVSLILISAILSCLDIFFISKVKGKAKIVQTVFADVSGINIISIFLTDSILKLSDKPEFFKSSVNDFSVAGLYFVTALIAGLVLFFIKALADGRLYVKKSDTADKKFIKTNIISAVLLFLGMAALTGTVWGMNTTGKVAADQMVVNLFSPRDGTSSDVISTILFGPVYGSFAVLALFCIFAFSLRELYVRTEKADKCIVSLKTKKNTESHSCTSGASERYCLRYYSV